MYIYIDFYNEDFFFVKSLCQYCQSKISPSVGSSFISAESFQLYIIRVQSKKTSWNVKRRFSEFFSLRQELARTNKNVISSYPFPAKVLFGSNLCMKLIEERKKCLQSFLQNILGNQQLCHRKEISTFLNNEVSINILINCDNPWNALKMLTLY